MSNDKFEKDSIEDLKRQGVKIDGEVTSSGLYTSFKINTPELFKFGKLSKDDISNFFDNYEGASDDCTGKLFSKK